MAPWLTFMTTIKGWHVLVVGAIALLFAGIVSVAD